MLLDETASLTESVASLAKKLGLQTKLGLDDGAKLEATVAGVLVQETPDVLQVDRESIAQAEGLRGQVDIVDLAILRIAHALKPDDGRRRDKC